MSLELSSSGCCNPSGSLSLGLSLSGSGSTNRDLSMALAISSPCCESPVRVVEIPATPPARDLIRITSEDFVSATEWEGANSEGVTILPGYSLKVFYNDGNRYLNEGTEWNRTATGFELVGLDTTEGDMTFYIHINEA